jgi:hypothetical protein
MRTETDIVIEPAKDDPGMWYWAFKVDGGVYADGFEATVEEAKREAKKYRMEWEDKNIP